ncbi:collagen, type I, alpha 1a isoform X3 [Syngnathus scovelli]|uniref:collagen, type I, alpha 1a isoform X3 n=1 Tax=Syngnathus scovelli TaxID=161590 RepID=UPI0035C94A9F
MSDDEVDTIIPPESEENQGEPQGQENQGQAGEERKEEALRESEDQGEPANEDESLPGASNFEEQGEPVNEEPSPEVSTSEDQGEAVNEEPIPGVSTFDDQEEPVNEEESLPGVSTTEEQDEPVNEEEGAKGTLPEDDQGQPGIENETLPGASTSEDQREPRSQVEQGNEPSSQVKTLADQGEPGNEDEIFSSEDQREPRSQVEQGNEPSSQVKTLADQGEPGNEDEIFSSEDQAEPRMEEDQAAETSAGVKTSDGGQERRLSESPGSEPHGAVAAGTTASSSEPLAARADSEQHENPDVINVSLRTDDSAPTDVSAGGGPPPAPQKAFLGGYRHKLTGTEYHHAASQTPRRARPGRGVDVVSRDAQVRERPGTGRDGTGQDGTGQDGRRPSASPESRSRTLCAADGRAGAAGAAVRLQRHHADDQGGLLHLQHEGQAAQPGPLHHRRRVSPHPPQSCDPSASAHPALAELPGGGPAAAGARPPSGLAGPAGAQEARGAGRAASRQPQPLDATAQEGGPQLALQRAGEVAERQGASDQRHAAGGREESRPVLAPGAGDAVHRHHRTPRHRHQEQQLQQSRQEVPGQVVDGAPVAGGGRPPDRDGHARHHPSPRTGRPLRLRGHVARQPGAASGHPPLPQANCGGAPVPADSGHCGADRQGGGPDEAAGEGGQPGRAAQEAVHVLPAVHPHAGFQPGGGQAPQSAAEHGAAEERRVPVPRLPAPPGLGPLPLLRPLPPEPPLPGLHPAQEHRRQPRRLLLLQVHAEAAEGRRASAQQGQHHPFHPAGGQSKNNFCIDSVAQMSFAFKAGLCGPSGGGHPVPGGGHLGVPLGPERLQRPVQLGPGPLGPPEGLEPLELRPALQRRDGRSPPGGGLAQGVRRARGPQRGAQTPAGAPPLQPDPHHGRPLGQSRRRRRCRRPEARSPQEVTKRRCY